MLCYDSFKNEFFNTDNTNYIHDLFMCEVIKGIDDTIVIENWYIPDKQEQIIYKRTIDTLFSSADSINKMREFYFELQYKKSNIRKNINSIIIPPKMYIMLQGSSKFIK